MLVAFNNPDMILISSVLLKRGFAMVLLCPLAGITSGAVVEPTSLEPKHLEMGQEALPIA